MRSIVLGLVLIGCGPAPSEAGHHGRPQGDGEGADPGGVEADADAGGSDPGPAGGDEVSGDPDGSDPGGGSDADGSDADGADPDGSDPDGADADEPVTGPPCTANGHEGMCIHVADCDGGRVTSPGFCAGPTQIRCCYEAPASCEVGAHPQPNRGLSEAAGDAGCPDGMLRIDTLCVDRFEAALIEVYGDGTSAPWSPFHSPGTRQVRAVSIEGAVPQGYISGQQAAGACAFAGKRLCTDVEWLRACRGPSSLTYPYGNVRQDGLCNDERAQHPVVQYFGTSEGWIWSELGNACIGQQADTVATSGAHAACESADGAFDMMGNLHEWTAAAAGTFRGGFYVDTSINGEGCLYATTAHDVSHWDYSTGFRCCADAE